MTGDSRSTAADRAELLPLLARSALAGALGVSEPVVPEIPEESPLRRPGASFVTLRRGGELRGCIGNLEAVRPLVDDVRSNARAAAFSDPRFPPVEAEELAGLTIEVSVLTPRVPIDFSSEEDLLSQLRPGVDGLMLVEGSHRGTFLPAVWRQLPEPVVFLRELKRKAGLDRDHWSGGMRVWRYSTVTYSE